MSATLELTEALLACPSVTPEDGGCQALIADRLRPLGFHCETIESGPASFRVTNLWALRRGAIRRIASCVPWMTARRLSSPA